MLEEKEMSELAEKYELFYKACTKLFSTALARILEDPRLPYKKKLAYIHKVDEYIDKAAEKRL